MSRQLLSRADQVFYGRATFGPYQADKPGLQVSLGYRWRPSGSAAAFTFTAALAAGATSGTLSANWAGPTGLFTITFSDTESLIGYFVNGSAAVKFYPATPPITGGGYGVAQSGSTANTAQAALVNAVTSAITVAGLPPALGVSTAVCTSQAVTTASPATINGTLASGGVATMDVPRNIIAAWTGTAIVTITGTDYYGQTQTWVSASGTSTASTKAFATVTSITVSANVTGFTCGTGNVLGLPFRINNGDFLAPMVGDAADAGTFTPPDLTLPATSTTGDVRGTYTPNTALNGVKFVAAWIKPTDPTTQVGSFGVTPA